MVAVRPINGHLIPTVSILMILLVLTCVLTARDRQLLSARHSCGFRGCTARC